MSEDLVFCTEKDCANEAVYSYVWPWGEKGAVCTPCLPALEQRAIALGRDLPKQPLPTTLRRQATEEVQRVAAEAEATLDALRSAADTAAVQIAQLREDATAKIAALREESAHREGDVRRLQAARTDTLDAVGLVADRLGELVKLRPDNELRSELETCESMLRQLMPLTSSVPA